MNPEHARRRAEQIHAAIQQLRTEDRPVTCWRCGNPITSRQRYRLTFATLRTGQSILAPEHMPGAARCDRPNRGHKPRPTRSTGVDQTTTGAGQVSSGSLAW